MLLGAGGESFNQIKEGNVCRVTLNSLRGFSFWLNKTCLFVHPAVSVTGRKAKQFVSYAFFPSHGYRQ